MKNTSVTVSGMLLVVGTFSFLFSAGSMMSGSSLFRVSGPATAIAGEHGTAIAVFKVKCYDVGREALSGLTGIQKVETGFHYIHETDTVYYDPGKITIEEMEKALKKAGTYVDTITVKERN